MDIKTEKVKGKDLKPGELFSLVGDEYWQHRDNKSIGERVYVRTNALLTSHEQEETIYRITVITKEENV